MLELGADVNALGYRNMSLERPLHLATRLGADPLVQWFIDNGADVTLLDGAGRSAADIARAKGYVHIYGMLVGESGVATGSGASEVSHSGGGNGQEADRTCAFDVIDVTNWTESIFFERYFESHRPVLVKGYADARWTRS